jgi:sec-independent protein translocase protein TatC
MATRLRPIGHEDRLSVIDHLDELRTRLVVCAITLAIAFGFCFWQNHALLDLLNKPLENSTPATAKAGGTGRIAGTSASQAGQRGGLEKVRRADVQLAHDPKLSPATRASYALRAQGDAEQISNLPKTVPKREPITTGVGEPFTTTLTVVLYFALLFSLPVLLFQAYSFILPAFSRDERRVALPVMLMVPFLFMGGVLFAYFLVLPPAISFLQNFNDRSFDVLIQAKPYYTFEIFTLLALGLMFQLPVGALAMQRVGIIDDRTLTKHWRYAIVIIAVLAAALPGVDPVTTALEMIPLLGLYGLSILLLKLGGRRKRMDAGDEDVSDEVVTDDDQNVTRPHDPDPHDSD